VKITAQNEQNRRQNEGRRTYGTGTGTVRTGSVANLSGAAKGDSTYYGSYYVRTRI